jgi:CheY-like chemotaxis protein
MNQTNEIKIILVEDDEGHAELIMDNLKEGGINNEIVHFDNGQKAVDAILSSDNNIFPGEVVMLLDMNLPGLDGIQVLKSLRENEKTKKMPICMLTTTENKTEIQKCYDLGCNNYITKPIEYSEFQDTMKKLGMLFSIVKFPETK